MSGCADEAFELGQAYFYGLGRRRNYRKAVALLLEAARAGRAHALNLLGFCSLEGLGVSRDHKRAATFWAAASEMGHPLATFNLATCYEMGRGVSRDLKRATVLYRRSALAGDVASQCNLGALYLDGKGVRRNPKTRSGVDAKGRRPGRCESAIQPGEMLPIRRRGEGEPHARADLAVEGSTSRAQARGAGIESLWKRVGCASAHHPDRGVLKHTLRSTVRSCRRPGACPGRPGPSLLPCRRRRWPGLFRRVG